MEHVRKIKLVIADDHNLFRKGTVSILEEFEDIESVLEAQDGKQLLELLQKHQPDVILLDLKMPNLSGIAAMPILYKKYPDVKVLVLSMHSEPSFIATLLREGANGYLLKDADIEEVIDAIRTVASGKNYINKIVAEALMQQVRPKNPNQRYQELGIDLTKQEEALLKLIIDQNTNTEIASKMNLGKRTVESYRERLMNKVGVKNVAGLVAFAIENGLVVK